MLYLRNTGADAGKAIVSDVFEWDVASWSRALPCWLSAMRAVVQRTDHPKAIDIGGRNGGLSLLAAIEGFEVVCTDLAHPRASAEPLHKKHQLADRISYAALDITDPAALSQHIGQYDLVMFKSILGGIGRNGRDDLQRATLANMRTLLKPGGVLCFAENLEGTALHRYFRRRFTRWGSEWNYPSLPKLHAMMHEAGLEIEATTTGVTACFGRSKAQRNALAKFDSGLANSLTPARWKYIVYGTATV